jgi:hypothetical protein
MHGAGLQRPTKRHCGHWSQIEGDVHYPPVVNSQLQYILKVVDTQAQSSGKKLKVQLGLAF